MILNAAADVPSKRINLHLDIFHPLSLQIYAVFLFGHQVIGHKGKQTY